MNKNRLGSRSLFKRIFSDNSYCWLSMICTAGIMMLVYFCFDLFPFGETTILRMDLYHQYGPLFAEFYDRVTNLKSFIYSWNTGLGSPFLGNFFNYLSSPSAIIMLILGHKNMPEAIAGMVLVKAAFSAASFTLYLKKSQGRHDFTTAAFGIFYAMCGFFVAYYWNVMWTDAMVYFPMVIYGIERIVNRRKPSVYIAFLALTLISSYYMGYMTCIFSVIYFIVYFLSSYDFSSKADNTVYYYDAEGNRRYTRIEKLKGNVFLRSGITFAAGSLAAGCLTAVSLIPTFIILRSCSATSGTMPKNYRSYFKIFDFLANHLASVEPTIRSSGEDVLPNVYCSMAVLILVPLYLFSKRITLKEKIAHVFTIGFIFFSFNINYLNYIWHGFHFPNDLPYRFSFMYSFVLLILAYKAFTRLDEFSGRQILGVGVAVVLAIVLIQKVGSKNVNDITVLLSIIFTVTYTLIFYLLQDIRKQKTAIAVVLLCCAIAEIACANTDRYSMSQIKSTFTSDYDSFREIKEQLDERENDEFYRMELTYNRARMDPAWFGYNGISTFSSMAYEKLANMQSNLGVYSNYINSYTYYVQTPVYNMMHALKYVVDNDPKVTIDDDYFTQVADVDKYTAYESKYPLSIGMAVNSDITGWYSAFNNPFSSQGEWFELATGVEYVFDRMDISDIRYYNMNTIDSGLDTGDIYFSKQGSGTGDLYFVLSVKETHHCYLFVDSSSFESIVITKDGESYTQDTDEPYIKDLGIITPETDLEVQISVEEDDSGYMDFFPYYVNDDKLEEGYEILKANQFNVTSFKETDIRGTISADKDCVFFSSIPYDKGWKVKIDGKEIAKEDYISLCDAYLCFNLPAGEHEIEMSFRQRGLIEGACISFAAVVALIAAAWFVGKNREKFRAAYEEKCRKASDDFMSVRKAEDEAWLAAKRMSKDPEAVYMPGLEDTEEYIPGEVPGAEDEDVSETPEPEAGEVPETETESETPETAEEPAEEESGGEEEKEEQ